MQITWKQVTGYQTEKPGELDITSSPSTVYLRKNIRQVEIEQGEETVSAWSYEEAELNLSEYAQYKEELESMNTAGYKAQEENQEVLMEALADVFSQQLELQENQMIIMDALADIYAKIGEEV